LRNSKRNILVLVFFLIFRVTNFAQVNKPLHEPPIINFQPNGLCYNSTTSFVNLTLSTAPTSYTWTIYQQGIPAPIFKSNQTDISIRFPIITTYTVQLEAQNTYYAVFSKVFIIDSVLTVDFDYSGCQSFFINYSTCADSYFWDFGDSTYSTQKAPSHYYKYYGNFTTKMVAKSGSKSDSIYKSFLAFPNSLSGDFTYHVNRDTINVLAVDTAGAGSYGFNWNWGDGTTSIIYGYSGAKQKHIYQKIGRDTTYNVSLWIKTLCNDGQHGYNVTIKDTTIITGTSVYPNPMLDGNILKILTDRPKEINSLSVLNYVGQPVTLYQITQKQTGMDIDFTDLPIGVYFLRFKVGNDLKSYKVIRR